MGIYDLRSSIYDFYSINYFAVNRKSLSFGGTIEYFRDTVFNYPTLAEACKVAALDGLHEL